MSDEIRLSAPAGTDVGVNFPFVMRIKHGPLDVTDMFELTRTFDLYEMEKNLADPTSYVKENILVDVLEVTPTETTIKVTPSQTMSYPLLAKHSELMLKAITKRNLKGKSQVVSIKWELDKTGVASDLRGMLRKVL